MGDYQYSEFYMTKQNYIFCTIEGRLSYEI